MASNNQVARIDPQELPSPEEALRLYEEAGGNLTHFSRFGEDPLRNDNTHLQQRSSEFHQRYPAFEPIFYKLVNSDDSLFREALLFFIHLTITLQ